MRYTIAYIYIYRKLLSYMYYWDMYSYYSSIYKIWSREKKHIWPCIYWIQLGLAILQLTWNMCRLSHIIVFTHRCWDMLTWCSPMTQWLSMCINVTYHDIPSYCIQNLGSKCCKTCSSCMHYDLDSLKFSWFERGALLGDSFAEDQASAVPLACLRLSSLFLKEEAEFW